MTHNEGTRVPGGSLNFKQLLHQNFLLVRLRHFDALLLYTNTITTNNYTP
jgi:hypothetical protein